MNVETAQHAVIAADLRLCNAVNSGDRKLLDAAVATNFALVLVSQEVIRDHDDILLPSTRAQAGPCLGQRPNVELDGNVAFVTGIVEQQEHGTQRQFVVTDLFVRRSGNWKAQRRVLARLDPQQYLEHALDLLRANYFRADHIDWSSVQRRAQQQSAGAQNSFDTYGAIRSALASMGDEHERLELNEQLRAKEEASKNRTEQQPETAANVQNSPQSESVFLHRSKPSAVLLHTGRRAIALLVVPYCYYPKDQSGLVRYTKGLLKAVAELEAMHPAGWIVDLRGNQGGNMWPMIAGLAPLLGNTDNLGGFFGTNENTTWFYRTGTAGERTGSLRTAWITVGPGYADSVIGGLEPKVTVRASVPATLNHVPVAVLLDRGTASSGEATAVAFRGRPVTRFFGEHSLGLSTAVSERELIDGAILAFAESVYVDRTGKQYPDGLDPDVPVNSGLHPTTDALDPVVAAALQWLSSIQD